MLLQNKHRSFSRKLSSSITGDIVASPTPEILTPASSKTSTAAESVIGEASAADELGSNESPQPATNEMALKADVLRSTHDERVLVVGKGVVLTANVTSCDKVIIEGQFTGNIKTGTFILSEGGQMEGEVRCEVGCIGGNMEATIVAARTLLIGGAAFVTGDMMYDSLQVIDGGRLQGKLSHFSSHQTKTVEAEVEAEAET